MFDNSVGMLVQGEFKAQGSITNHAVLTLGNDTTVTNSSKVRLVGGPNEYEGRVEIRPNPSVDQWGTICKEVSWVKLYVLYVFVFVCMCTHLYAFMCQQK